VNRAEASAELCYAPPVAHAHAPLLSKVNLFSGLAPDALDCVAAIAIEERHPRGSRLFQHGDPGDKVYIILSGKIRVSRDIPGMGEEALAVLGPGDVCGEMSLFDDAPRSADAHVHEGCSVLAIPKDSFEQLLFLRPDLAHDVLWQAVRIMVRRLRETNDKFTFLSVTSKF
jgi:CRP/FNR family transcriptional regulator, cyclic AMP receptor protein